LTLSSPFAPSTEDATTNNLTYDSLLASLSLPDAASLESLVTQSIYSGLLVARLSPTSNPPVVNVTSVAPLRDLRPQSLPALLQILQTWESRCTSMVNDLEAQITAIRTTATNRNTKARRRQEAVDAAVLSEKPLNDATDGGKGNTAPRALRSGATKLPSKRNLDQEAEGEEDDLSDDDGRMDLDEGIDVGTVGGIGGGGASASRGGAGGSSRGAKRNRGRGK
jgi:COP9 signalosome complex subunit 7